MNDLAITTNLLAASVIVVGESYGTSIHCKNKMSQNTHMEKRMIATEKKHFYVSLRFNKAH